MPYITKSGICAGDTLVERNHDTDKLTVRNVVTVSQGGTLFFGDTKIGEAKDVVVSYVASESAIVSPPAALLGNVTP
jgi:hypothetical protein